MSKAEKILREHGIDDVTIIRVWFDSGNDVEAIMFRQEDEILVFVDGPISQDRWHEITEQMNDE